MMIIQPKSAEENYSHRWHLLLMSLLLALTVLIGRAIYLQVLDRQFLQKQGDMRHVDVLPLPKSQS